MANKIQLGRSLSLDYARKLDTGALKPKVYYSQNREDLILSAFFPDDKTGFYVDVGAYDPDYDSVTKLFYDKKWSGINIEPQPDKFQSFPKKRPRDINLNIGVSNTSGELILRSFNNQGLSTFDRSIIGLYEKNKPEGTSDYTDIKVRVKTLKEIFIEHKIKKIQFMKIDVEGLESSVVRGNDWSKFRPEVVCVERNHADEEWRVILENNNYSQQFDDGLNAYYVDNASHRGKKFDYVKYILEERGGGLKSEEYEKILNLKELAMYFEALVWKDQIEIQKRDSLITKQELEITSIKKTGLRLLKLIKRNLIR